jgi:hypothetical protein
VNHPISEVVAALAIAGALGESHAAMVTSMNISDTIDSNTSSMTPIANDGEFYTSGPGVGPDGLGSDGAIGAFRFSPFDFDLDTYSSAKIWTGDLNGGVINLAGAAPQSFSSGFIFGGFRRLPYTTGAIVANTSAFADTAAIGTVLGSADISFSSLPWAVVIDTGISAPPDPGTLVVSDLIKTGASSYAYRLSFSHLITSADDPSETYVGFKMQWVLEGSITTVPETAIYNMMVAGIGIVGVMASRRRHAAR